MLAPLRYPHPVLRESDSNQGTPTSSKAEGANTATIIRRDPAAAFDRAGRAYSPLRCRQKKIRHAGRKADPIDSFPADVVAVSAGEMIARRRSHLTAKDLSSISSTDRRVAASRSSLLRGPDKAAGPLELDNIGCMGTRTWSAPATALVICHEGTA